MSHEAPAHEAEEGQAAAAEAKPAKGGKLKFIAIIMAAMIVEAAVFFVVGFGSGGHEVEAATDGHGEEKKPAEPPPPPPTSFVEAELDGYSITNRLAAADTTLQVSFKLYALVAGDQKVAFETAAREDNKARVREAVERLIRTSTLDDLNDPALSSLKRQIREEINRILRQSYVSEIILSEYKTIER